MTSKYAIALAQKQIKELEQAIGSIMITSRSWTEFVIDLCARLDEFRKKLNEVENNHSDMV